MILELETVFFDQDDELTHLIRLCLAANVLQVWRLGNSGPLINVMAAADALQLEAEGSHHALEQAESNVARVSPDDCPLLFNGHMVPRA
jgi:hypothetical protein